VFGNITKLVKCPKGVIPSLVRLERFKQVADFRWQILAASGQIVEHMKFIRAEGKLSRFRSGIARVSDCNGESGLIQNGPEIVSAVENDSGQELGKLFCELNLVNLCRAVGIVLNNVGPWLFFPEPINFDFEIGQVTLRVSEHLAGTGEDVSH